MQNQHIFSIKNLRIIVFTFLNIFYLNNISGQKSSLTKDTLGDKSLKWSQPKKATILSTVLPGLGQCSNKKYWKVPFIYSLLGGFGYLIYTNHKDYIEFRDAIKYRYDDISGNETYLQFSVDNLVTLKRTYQRFRDYSILGAGLIYLLQIIDANVDAHLLNFDVENISMKIKPEITPFSNASNNNFIGVNLTLTPKK